jgi:hypothetical protein
LSRSGPAHVFALQNEPALARLPTLINTPWAPLCSSADRTPRL